MSDYQNFIFDFPKRCRELQELCKSEVCTSDARDDRDVTLLLAVAMAGIIAPLERLKYIQNEEDCHQGQDRESNPRRNDRFDKLFSARVPFLGSDLWKAERGPGSWKFRNDIHPKDIHPRSVPEDFDLPPIGPRFPSVKYVLTGIRNALAHSNFGVSGNPIRALSFLSRYVSGPPEEKEYRYSYCQVDLEDFQIFLDNWFEFLRNLNWKELEEAYIPGEVDSLGVE